MRKSGVNPYSYSGSFRRKLRNQMNNPVISNTSKTIVPDYASAFKNFSQNLLSQYQ